MTSNSPSKTTTSALKNGYTTGSCATAASAAAYMGFITGSIPNSICIYLPKGQKADFTIVRSTITSDLTEACVIKDAGDDPDVTHGAEISVRISKNPSIDANQIHFKAGSGVGIITKPGLPIGVGEPAINPVPRKMMLENLTSLSELLGAPLGITLEISIKNGEKIAKKTWNPRLGIEGGLSILGTSGIVRPYSCSAWIHSIHQGIDVARATNQTHIAICTGSTSEKALITDFDEGNIIDIGGFFGGFCKYYRNKPTDELTLAAGFAKLTKIAQGENILHGNRSQVNFNWLSQRIAEIGPFSNEAEHAQYANSVLEVIENSAHTGICERICTLAKQRLMQEIGEKTKIHVLAINREGEISARV